MIRRGKRKPKRKLPYQDRIGFTATGRTKIPNQFLHDGGNYILESGKPDKDYGGWFVVYKRTL